MGRALVRNPEVFLLDEPFSNLKAKLRAHVRTAIKKLHQKPKSTFVYVTHDQIEAMTLSARIAVLYRSVCNNWACQKNPARPPPTFMWPHSSAIRR